MALIEKDGELWWDETLSEEELIGIAEDEAAARPTNACGEMAYAEAPLLGMDPFGRYQVGGVSVSSLKKAPRVDPAFDVIEAAPVDSEVPVYVARNPRTEREGDVREPWKKHAMNAPALDASGWRPIKSRR